MMMLPSQRAVGSGLPTEAEYLRPTRQVRGGRGRENGSERCLTAAAN